MSDVGSLAAAGQRRLVPDSAHLVHHWSFHKLITMAIPFLRSLDYHVAFHVLATSFDFQRTNPLTATTDVGKKQTILEHISYRILYYFLYTFYSNLYYFLVDSGKFPGPR